MVKFIRRTILALIFTLIAGVVVRFKGRGGVPTQQGGWREVTPQK